MTFIAAQMLLATQLSTMAQAEMLSTNEVISKYASYADRDFLLSELNRQEIRDELVARGVDPKEAETRLNALSNEEIASVLQQMEHDTAGGNGIVGALLTVFIILLVTDLLCLTKVFPFTRCAGR
ncbi:PA2779 family protein [Ruegeria lacuscaerulensis]|uniref:PA2779 family protein n=1 Tax=Ruegeria lacuscaerulensis TaxID=55218 RepID=UPI001F3320BE|nr:PA2779 family protein [Ruegeria lacuscaerulensis]